MRNGKIKLNSAPSTGKIQELTMEEVNFVSGGGFPDVLGFIFWYETGYICSGGECYKFN